MGRTSNKRTSKGFLQELLNFFLKDNLQTKLSREQKMEETQNMNKTIIIEDAPIFDTDKEAMLHCIKKWETIVEILKDRDIPQTEISDINSCALCQLYFENDECKGCPISTETGEGRCKGTPYNTYSHKKTAVNAQSQVDFLKSVAKKNGWLEDENPLLKELKEIFRDEFISFDEDGFDIVFSETVWTSDFQKLFEFVVKHNAFVWQDIQNKKLRFHIHSFGCKKSWFPKQETPVIPVKTTSSFTSFDGEQLELGVKKYIVR